MRPLCFLFVLNAGLASAQPELRGRFRDAVRLLEAGDAAGACNTLDDLRRRVDTANIRWNLAVCHDALGEDDEVRRHLGAFLTLAATDDARRAVAFSMLRTPEDEVAIQGEERVAEAEVPQPFDAREATTVEIESTDEPTPVSVRPASFERFDLTLSIERSDELARVLEDSRSQRRRRRLWGGVGASAGAVIAASVFAAWVRSRRTVPELAGPIAPIRTSLSVR